eukprot:356695-Chlamydomonas_euryale.AAC.1
MQKALHVAPLHMQKALHVAPLSHVEGTAQASPFTCRRHCTGLPFHTSKATATILLPPLRTAPLPRPPLRTAPLPETREAQRTSTLLPSLCPSPTQRTREAQRAHRPSPPAAARTCDEPPGGASTRDDGRSVSRLPTFCCEAGVRE